MDRILCRHNVTGHTADFPEDALPAWRGLGWIPVSELDEQEDAPGAPTPAEPAPTPTKPARTRAASAEEPTP
jgi:hypothetical protein